MRLFLIISMSCMLAGGAMAQRGGGGHGGGGGGGFHGGGGFSGGGFRGGGGFGGGGFVGGGFRGGGFGGFRGGLGYGYRGYGGYGGWGLGLGYGWGWPGYYGGYYDSYPYNYYAPYGTYYDPGAYAYSPNTTVVYPPQQPSTVYVQPPVHSSLHVYDEYGQEVGNGGGSAATRPTSSPLYLIALQDHVIHTAISYRVEGSDLIYVTEQHEEKRVPLTQVDRSLSMQLNRERRVQFNLP